MFGLPRSENKGLAVDCFMAVAFQQRLLRWHCPAGPMHAVMQTPSVQSALIQSYCALAVRLFLRCKHLECTGRDIYTKQPNNIPHACKHDSSSVAAKCLPARPARLKHVCQLQVSAAVEEEYSQDGALHVNQPAVVILQDVHPNSLFACAHTWCPSLTWLPGAGVSCLSTVNISCNLCWVVGMSVGMLPPLSCE